MNCEICKKAPAQTAIFVDGGENGEERELYVCKKCARLEKLKKSKKLTSVRTPGAGDRGNRGKAGDGNGSDGETDSSPDGPALQDFSDSNMVAKAVGAVAELMNGISETLGRLEKSKRLGSRGNDDDQDDDANDKTDDREAVDVKALKIDRCLIMHNALHLEGLYLIGEIEPVNRAAAALDLELHSDENSTIRSPGHIYSILYRPGHENVAKRFAADLATQEENARYRLFHEELELVFMDASCRALALLKNCRLLSAAEELDMLSSLRLAAQAGIVEGISLRKITKMMEDLNADDDDPSLTTEEREVFDSMRANKINAVFEDVLLKEPER